MRVRVAEELKRLAHAFVRRIDYAHGVARQHCRLCGDDVGTLIEGPYAEAEVICADLARSFDDHDCARINSAMYWTNDGLDELYARSEALSVEMAGRAIELVRDGAAPHVIARVEHESRELARRAKTLEWILERGVLVGSAP
jgi:hypothetical protein